ncbi:Putative Ca2+/H+ antiporter, TMEM165/GDT1 family [Pseudonocardia thermophila]|jgi:Predicted membrane protein|uniref:Putative Ca2+/H+ antiporter, TMEM165/GDT1 family n=2 Tax=Pseudonocardia thermophila TaxID=1848 RepID=A0A1M7B2Y0_PSETH|nr:Putative Ca2+/H+ antiporter, TMEM165/GDT1 family [Pseudonocardia thermophila]
MESFGIAFAISFWVVFVAELGDKSQLMALTFAARYRALPVLAGITIATSVVHLISVAVGYGLGAALPTDWITLVAALAFLGFGAWTLRGDSLSEEEQAKAQRARGSAVVAASGAFFLAELGDKTMLATITLATQHGWFGVWLGSTLGMVGADAIAIVAGRRMARFLPEDAVRIGSAALFVVFGLWLAAEAAAGFAGTTIAAAVESAIDHHVAGWIALGIGAGAAVLVGFARMMLRRMGKRRLHTVVPRSSVLLSRALFTLALLLGFAAPLLVALDVLQPIAVFAQPGVAVVGAGLALLGVALLLATQLEGAAVRARGEALPQVTRGLYARVRHPGLTGLVIVTAGTLVMVPTLVGVLAAVLVIVAVQVQVRAVREPGFARLYGPAYAEWVARTGRFLPRFAVEPPPGLPGRAHQRVG